MEIKDDLIFNCGCRRCLDGPTAFPCILCAGVDAGTDKMKEISKLIQDGARVFMLREFSTLFIFAIIVGALLWYGLNEPSVAITFGVGVVVSSLVAYLSMSIATKANARVANLAVTSFPDALKTAFSGGAVMGFSVVGFGLLGLVILFVFFEDANILLGYAFGASSVALFLRVGGGIFTKSADVGADLVGKVEKSIPEDDPRNPATIADNVGDNVGDIAGMGSDLFESYISAIIAAMFLGLLISAELGVLPIFLAGAGIIASIIGSFFVRAGKGSTSFKKQTQAAKNALNKGVIVANLVMIAASYFIVKAFVGELNIFYALIVGLISGFLIGKITEYFTSGRIVEAIARQSGNAATNIIHGLSSGMFSVVLPVIVVAP